MRTLPLLSSALLLACASPEPASGDSAESGPSTVDWSPMAVRTVDLPAVRGQVTRRGIVHLHSAWSHDACDGSPLVDGAPNQPCLDDLRAGLCAAGIDVAWLTDHPTHAADQPFDDRLHVEAGRDTWVERGGAHIGARWVCDADGAAQGDATAEGSALLRPGYEDDLMPVGMQGPLAADLTTESELARAATEASMRAMQAAGADVMMAHTEGKTLDLLEPLVDMGLAGVEIFSLHAAFDPNIRGDDLGLDPLGWTDGLTTFTAADAVAEPDLMVTGVLVEQTPSIARWDALQARARVVGTAGTDAHQNVLPMLLADGERGDSYRRSLRWMSQHLRLLEGDDPADPIALQAALVEGRSAVVLEILGTPIRWDLTVEAADGGVAGTGERSPGGTLVVACPTLAPQSPQGETPPEITATIFKDGAEWATGCGDHPTDGPGAYRVRFDVIPHHLRPFYGDDPDAWIERRPWVWTQHVHVTG